MRRLTSILMILFVAAGVFGCDNAPKNEKPKAEEPKADAGNTNNAKPDQANKPAEAGADDPVLLATGPIAKVNGKEITAESFNKEIGRLKNVASRIPPGALTKFKESTVTRMIDQNLVESAIDAQKITVNDDEIAGELTKFETSMGGKEGVERFYQQTGMTEAEVKSDMRRAVQLEKLLKTKYGIKVDEPTAKKFYDENIQRFTQEEEVKASHILIKLEKDAAPDVVKEKQKVAKDIFKKAKAKDADFAALAREFSEGPTASRGGDLGFFSKKRMVPAFSEAAFKTKIGGVTGPVRSEFGFHVIKVFEKKDANVTKYAEVKEEIVKNLERKEMRDATKKLIEELRKDAKIEQFNENIKENAKAQPASSPMMMPGMMPGGKPPVPPAPKTAPSTPPPAGK